MQEDGSFPGLPMMALPPGGPVQSTATASAPLDNRAKAAIVVRLLLNEGAELPLEELPDELQAVLTQQMGRMSLVDRNTLTSVVEEFVDAVEEVGLAFPNGIAGALSALDGKISPQTAARLRKEAGVRRSGDPWERLRALPVEDILVIVESESIEVAAVVLSKLDTTKAAALLNQMPGPLARRITYAVSQTDSVTPEAVDRIGLSLAAQLDEKPIPAFDDEPGARVGAILNHSAAKTREEMLTSLDETDAEFAERVRKQIFTFAHIPVRIKPRDVPAVVRTVNPATLVIALAGTTNDDETAAATFLLENMSQRMADNLRDEVADRGKVKAKEGEESMKDVVGAIRLMIESGEIEMIDPDEEEDEA